MTPAKRPPLEPLIESIDLAIERPQDINAELLQSWRDAIAALASPSAEAAQPVAMDWPHLVQLGRCLGLFASGIKAVGEWSKFYQSEYDKANLALQEVFKELAALSQPQGELREALTQVEGACLRIEMVSQAMRKGDPSSGLLNEAVATIRAALAGRTAG
jgi:hypothetical protein